MRFTSSLYIGQTRCGEISRELKCEIGGVVRWHLRPWRYSNEGIDRDGSAIPRFTNIAWLCFSYTTHDWREWIWDAAQHEHVLKSGSPSLENA